jgi:hypothetical protein
MHLPAEQMEGEGRRSHNGLAFVALNVQSHDTKIAAEPEINPSLAPVLANTTRRYSFIMTELVILSNQIGL